MKIFLKNGKLSVRESLGPLHKEGDSIEFDPLGFKDSHAYKFEYAINDDKFKPIEGNKIPLDIDPSKERQVVFKIRETNVSNRKKKVYTSEVIPVCTYIYLGKGTDTMYPQKIEQMQKEINDLKIRTEKLESEGDLL